MKGFKEFAENRKFYEKRGKVTETLDELLYRYGEKNGYNMSDDDMDFIKKWNLMETYIIYKHTYETRHKNDRKTRE